jgi:hypothetical protein
MAYGNTSGYGSRSPALRDYLDQRRMPQNPMPNMPGGMGAPMGGMPQPTMGAPAPPGPIQSAPTGARMPMPAYQPQGGSNGLLPTPTAPSPGGSFFDRIRAKNPNTPQATLEAQVAGFTPEQQQMFHNWVTSLYRGGDFEGRHEQNQMLAAQLAQRISLLNSQPQVDYSGSSGIADQFGNQREQLMNALAARGIAGSGVEAGALANSYGQEAKAMGGFRRDQDETRRRENMAVLLDFMRRAEGAQDRGLMKNWEEQADPGFWGDVAGVLGNVAGAAIPGIGGAIGGAIGGLFGGNSQQQQPQYGSMYGGPSWYGPGQPGQYPPVDYNQPYYTGGY